MIEALRYARGKQQAFAQSGAPPTIHAMAMNFQRSFDHALTYANFLNQHGTESDRGRWELAFNQVQLTDEQLELIGGFRRQMKVLVMAGAWCGDCVAQCPIVEQVSLASRLIETRYVDRDHDHELADELQICGAPRVPQVVFFNEDLEPVSRFGDRTLAKYRDMDARLSGAACSTGIIGADDPLTRSVIAEWIAEFERVQLILRTSPKLRQRYDD